MRGSLIALALLTAGCHGVPCSQVTSAVATDEAILEAYVEYVLEDEGLDEDEKASKLRVVKTRRAALRALEEHCE